MYLALGALALIYFVALCFGIAVMIEKAIKWVKRLKRGKNE